VNENEMLCTKKGIVYSGGKCRKFLYDPQKRIPARLPPPVLEIEEEEGLSENAPPSVPPQ